MIYRSEFKKLIFKKKFYRVQQTRFPKTLKGVDDLANSDPIQNRRLT